ncbi:enoyl-CoA hydratase/isomerase family protein [Niveispirillum sp. SYP-B3756]|uniref:enoyl-CoA hydratase/isomerase family protein n=1 Tax=Niveispirillum sp. SYP-B3756 TaxID=2662178 RepID=UPI001291BC90|nr:enoyl-CoA hydratase/isomerase family protein [Niveispirillum sp. SYP-B3756]MQP68291.1 enoyl-CoA hydratase/isomerase family protein [Niveispirillum sp. SYP-B3756]
MEFVDIVYEQRGRGAWIRLNRPDALNTINPGLAREFDAALDLAEENPEIVTVAVTGTGRAFCAGADLKFLGDLLQENSEHESANFQNQLMALMARLEKFPKPVICAVNGVSTGGGTELLLCCDLVIAVASAKIGDGHANYGLLPGGGASIRLPRKIGPTRAKYLLFTGELRSAAELVTCGLVNEVVEDGALEAAVDGLVDKLSSKSPLALKQVKMLVDDGLEQPLDTALRLELLASTLHSHSHDMHEGVAAFNAKRKPSFKGC